MKNIGLKNSLKHFVNNVLDIVSITKGDVGGISIEVETKDPPAFDSYLYKDKLKRDEDFNEFVEFTNNLKKQKNEPEIKPIRNKRSIS